MLKDEMIKMKWNVSNRDYYIKKKYKYTKLGDEFYVHSNDLTPNSKRKVTCICDICSTEWTTRRATAQNICVSCKRKLAEDAWSEEDIKLLKEIYPICRDIHELAVRLNRSDNAVVIKANRLGITREERSHKYYYDSYKVKDSNLILEQKIIGYEIGDGWISESITTYPEGRERVVNMCGFSGSVIGLKNIQKDLEKVYGEKCYGEISHRPTSSLKYKIEGTSNQFHVNAGVTKRFISMKLPVGKRVEKEFYISDFLDLDNLDYTRSFFCGLYNAEGTKISMQSNKKTIRAPQLILTKRKEKYINFIFVINQILKIVDDIGLECNLKLENTQTKAANIKARIVFKNNYGNIFRFFNIVDFNYAPEKNNSMIIAYCLAKAYCNHNKNVKKNIKVYEQCLDKLSSNQINSIRIVVKKFKHAPVQGVMPKNFCDYIQFKSIVRKLNRKNPIGK